jgi:hypothetical protein
MTLAKAKAKTKETFIVQASLTIVTYDHQNILIALATGDMCKMVMRSTPEWS